MARFVLYRQDHGHLVETVEAWIRFGQPAAAAQPIVSLRGQQYTAALPATSDFGEHRVEFSVPEWKGEARAKLDVLTGARKIFNLSLVSARKWTIFIVSSEAYPVRRTLYRSLYYSKALSRADGIPLNYPNTTDVPSYTGSYPSVLASAGIQYWAVGGNNDRAPVLAAEPWDRESPFWWEGPDGKKVLFEVFRDALPVPAQAAAAVFSAVGFE